MKKYQYLASWDDQTLTRVGEPVVVLGDSNVSQVEVTLPSNFLLDPTKAECRMYFLLPGEKESDYDVLETATKDENGDSHVTWTIKHVHSQKGGRLAFSLTLIGDDAQWDSRTAIIPVYESRYQPESEEAEEPYTGRLDALEGSMASIRGEFAEVQDDFEELKETATLGTPIPESLVANMTEGHVYIYTGTEPGYTAGHVYYYVGGALTDGGVYGGTAVDATLTQSGQAADAKKTGDEISQIKEDLSAVSEKKLISGWASGYINTSGSTTKLTVVSDATFRYVVIPAAEGDIFELTITGGASGRAWAWVDKSGNILSKANSNAALSGEVITSPANTDILILVDKSGSPVCYQNFYTLKRISNLENDVSSIKTEDEDRDILIDKTAHTTTEYAGNIFDTSGGATGRPTTFTHVFDDGTYYSNPFTTISAEIHFAPVDKYGNAIKMFNSKTQTEVSSFNISNILYRLTFSKLTIHYESFANLANYNAGIVNSDYYLTLTAAPHHWEILFYGYSEGDAIERGLTKGFMSETYVAYSAPATAHKYTEELDNHINEIVDDSMGEILVPSYNLIDMNYLTGPINGYYRTKNGYYMPVTPGKAITCNAQSWTLTFYDSAYTSVGTAGSPNPYVASIVPETAAWATFSMGVGNGDNFGLVIWETDTVQGALYERPIVRPNKKIAAKYLDSDIYNYAVPDSLNQGIMQMARFAAIRSSNEMRDAYRFGTWNAYQPGGNVNSKRFKGIGDYAYKYALDFLGTQETRVSAENLQKAAPSFQFPYGTGEPYTDGDGYTEDLQCVSRFEITDVQYIRGSYSSSYKSYYWCQVVKMNLPQNKHYPRVPTLSVYNYHGSLSLSQRLTDIEAILSVIAEDTSDFIIIMGDTNSEVDSTGHRQSWDAWEAAGFTAVHHGESPTWPWTENPTRYSSMDNIFVSSHINVLHYDIIDGTTAYCEDGTTKISDHDLVFADLQFDFDAVLKDTWEEPATVN